MTDPALPARLAALVEEMRAFADTERRLAHSDEEEGYSIYSNGHSGQAEAADKFRIKLAALLVGVEPQEAVPDSRDHLITRLWDIAAKFPTKYCNAVRDPIHLWSKAHEAAARVGVEPQQWSGVEWDELHTGDDDQVDRLGSVFAALEEAIDDPDQLDVEDLQTAHAELVTFNAHYIALRRQHDALLAARVGVEPPPETKT